MRKEERFAASVLLAVGIWASYDAYWMIGFGSFRAPGPGFFPFWLALFLGVLSAYYLAVAYSQESKRLWLNESWRRPMFAGLVMVAYSLSFDRLGFVFSTALLFFAWLRIIENETVKKAITVALAGTAAAYALFSFLLDVRLPHGFWL